jgi:hypothetical protein
VQNTPSAVEQERQYSGKAGGALKKFLDLPESSDLSEEDRELCFSVTSQSWSALGLPGDPRTPSKISLSLATFQEFKQPTESASKCAID